MTEELPENLLEKLKKEIDLTSWSELAPHEQRSALILVDEALDLATVALKVAEDDVKSIQEWLGSGQLTRPSKDQIESFAANPMHKQFQFLIVQPYVLATIIVS